MGLKHYRVLVYSCIHFSQLKYARLDGDYREMYLLTWPFSIFAIYLELRLIDLA